MEPASLEWCARYPTSRSVDDLKEPFRGRVIAFLAELTRLGCSVRILATYRPPERAWLMHWAWMIDQEGLDPSAVPAHDPPIDIEWTREGAKEMVDTYGLVVEPSLTSRHITREAIDMHITGWAPRPSTSLWAMGQRYGVRKLEKDPPHWSVDGR